MSQFLSENVGLVLPKRVETKVPWCHVYATSAITDHVAVSLKTIDYCFPLYVYPDLDKSDLFSQHESGERVPNLSPKLIQALRSSYGRQPNSEDIFNYIYAVLHSTAFRRKYAEFLKTDFPHVPFTKDFRLFQKLAKKGAKLVELHLLKAKKFAKPIAKCEGSGDLRVEKVLFDAKKSRVYVNLQKYFTGVSSDIWEFHIGGYQVADKWLKDRRGRTLSTEEISTYTRVVTAIGETISIQESLDHLFQQVELNLLEVSL